MERKIFDEWKKKKKKTPYERFLKWKNNWYQTIGFGPSYSFLSVTLCFFAIHATIQRFLKYWDPWARQFFQRKRWGQEREIYVEKRGHYGKKRCRNLSRTILSYVSVTVAAFAKGAAVTSNPIFPGYTITAIQVLPSRFDITIEYASLFLILILLDIFLLLYWGFCMRTYPILIYRNKRRILTGWTLKRS